MTAEDKSKELVNKYYGLLSWNLENNFTENDAIECALICVDEIINGSPSKIYWQTYDDEQPSAITFWDEVKQQLQKLKK